MNIEGLYLVTTKRNLKVVGPDQVERCMYFVLWTDKLLIEI